jgi:predicted transcriptional regulator
LSDNDERNERQLPRRLVLDVGSNPEQAVAVFKALASDTRLRILELTTENIYNISEIAERLRLPFSTANMHVNVLEEAGLLLTEQRPARRGAQKVCARAFNTIIAQHSAERPREESTIEISMPIGAYSDFDVAPTCGLAGENGIIALVDDSTSFFEPQRTAAHLLWFHQGYVEYRFPNRLPPGSRPGTLSLSFEACSEAPLHHADWPSDITVWINGVELGTWTSPADFGGRRGHLTPAWWERHNSQYGLLKVWQVDQGASYVDGVAVSQVTLEDLSLADGRSISVRIGIKEDAHHVGGINLFGRGFGNYPQDIILRLQPE